MDKDLAKKCFAPRYRNPGDEQPYYALTDVAPEWLHQAVRDAHNGTMPNDWIYETCKDAWLAIAVDESITDSDDIHEWADGYIDIYTSHLAEWYKDMCCTRTFSLAEEEANDLGFDPNDTIEKRLQIIQYCAIRYIAEVMFNYYTEHCETAENTEEE